MGRNITPVDDERVVVVVGGGNGGMAGDGGEGNRLHI